MGTYPIKLLRDEQGTPFVPLVSSDSVQTLEGEKLTKLLDDKLSPEDLVAGQYIELNTEEGKTTISVDLPASVNTINNLTTETSGQGALDAYQGKVLKDSIPALVDSLDSTDANKALSARQGKILNEKTVPEGGKVGQVLKKSSNADHSLEWGDAADPNAIVGDGTIMSIVELSYEEYKTLESNGQLKEDTEYHITDMNTPIGVGMKASQVEMSDGFNVEEVIRDDQGHIVNLSNRMDAVEDRLDNKDTVDEGQNTRLDLAESNIDTIVSTVNDVSATVGEHNRYLNSYTPCKIINTPAQTTPEGVIEVLANANGNIDRQYMTVAAKIVNDNIGSYLGTNPNISTGGPNFQAFVSGTTTLYTVFLTNYSSSYVVLLKRINNYFYGTYIGP